MTSLKKDLITLLNYSSESIAGILDSASEMKKNRLAGSEQAMKGRTGVLIFEKPSLRTRITFETAIHELGGHPINLGADMVQMGKRESVEDVARNLERWVHILVVRTFLTRTLEKLAMHSSIPVINALTDDYHPCQALAFGLTLKECLKGQKRVKVVFVGDGNNVCASLMILCAKLGYDFTLSCPPGYELPSGLVESCSEIAAKRSCRISVTNDPASSVKDATVIYTDVWASMGQEKEEKKRSKEFAAFQINAELLRHAPSDAYVSHCLPAHRGKEITSDILDSERSLAFDEAENRLHVQKAVIVHLLS